MINLLPYKEKKSIEKIRFVRMVESVVLAVLLLVVISFILLVPTWITINSRLGIYSNQVISLEKNGMITNGVDINTLESRASKVQNKLAISDKVSPTKYIEIVRSITPSGITINRFVAEADMSLSVFGISKDRELLQTFIEALGSNQAVLTIDNPVSNFIKNKNGTFKLTVMFK